jgi:C-terminal processing protease CtpA/Prc
MIRKKFFIFSMIFVFAISGILDAKINSFPWSIKDDLSKEQTENLEAITKLYGIVRYFYPNQQTENFSNLDWHKFLSIVIEKTLNTRGDKEFETILKEFFQPIVPELILNQESKEATKQYAYSNGFYIWEHYGFGRRPVDNVFSSEIKYINQWTNDYPVPDSLYKFQLKNQLYIYLPIAISYKHDRKSKDIKALIKLVKNKKNRLLDISELNYIINDILKQKNKQQDFTFIRNENNRIADIMMKWSIIRHFYPYCQEDGLDLIWDDALTSALKSAASCNNIEEYYDIVRELLGYVHDSHITVHTYASVSKLLAVHKPVYTISPILDWVGRQIYLRSVPDSMKSILFKGDILTSINGMAIDSVIEKKLKLIPASSQQGKYEALINNVLIESFKYRDTFRLKFKNPQETEVELLMHANQYSPQIINNDNYPFFIKEIEDNIYYINLTYRDENATYAYFKSYINNLKQAKGIIIDIRGYPDYHVADSVITHFSKNPVQWGDFRRPIRYYPNQRDVIYKESVEYLPVSDDYIATPVCILINHKAMSYAETVIEIIKRNQLGTLIGEPTIGTNGDITSVNMPIFGFLMTAVKDFSGNHGKGVMPDIYVQTTLEAIRENRDEILETALKFLKYGMDANNWQSESVEVYCN